MKKPGDFGLKTGPTMPCQRMKRHSMTVTGICRLAIRPSGNIVVAHLDDYRYGEADDVGGIVLVLQNVCGFRVCPPQLERLAKMNKPCLVVSFRHPTHGRCKSGIGVVST
jgi:hypothetical protein